MGDCGNLSCKIILDIVELICMSWKKYWFCCDDRTDRIQDFKTIG